VGFGVADDGASHVSAQGEGAEPGVLAWQEDCENDDVNAWMCTIYLPVNTHTEVRTRTVVEYSRPSEEHVGLRESTWSSRCSQ